MVILVHKIETWGNVAFRVGLIQQLDSTHLLFELSRVQLLSKGHGFHLASNIFCVHLIPHLWKDEDREKREEADGGRDPERKRERPRHKDRKIETERGHQYGRMSFPQLEDKNPRLLSD